MSRWLMWIGSIMIGIGLGPTVADYLPIDLWDRLLDPGWSRADHYQIVPVKTGVYFPSDIFIGTGLVVLIAGVVLKRYGR